MDFNFLKCLRRNKKLFTLLLLAATCFSLVACGGDATGNADKGGNKSVVVTAENWANYLEFVVETDESDGFLNYRLYLKAKEDTIISNELNARVQFSYNMKKQHYNMQNNKVVLGECEAIEDTYTHSFPLYRNQNEEKFCEDIDAIMGNEWSFNDGNRWTNIPNNFVITKIEGTIVAG